MLAASDIIAQKEKFAEIIDFETALQPPSMIMGTVIKLTSTPSTQVDELVTVLSSEPTIAAFILRLSNSALYGRSRTVDSVKEAVVMLGFHSIRSIVITHSTQKLFSDATLGKQHRDRLWEHSLATAIGARLLSQRSLVVHPEFAYLGGLLHDIGKLLMAQNFPEEYDALLSGEDNYASEHIRKESEIFGIDHAMAGAILINEWLFPEPLVEAVAAHHQMCNMNSIAGTIALADLLATKQELNIHPHESSNDKILTDLGLMPLLNDVQSAVDEQLSLLMT